MESSQERVVKDVSSLHWFLKHYISKDEDYTKYQSNIHKGMTYLGRLFNQCNSITTIDIDSSCFTKYALVENNKVLRLTYRWGQIINNEDVTILVQELFSKANDFVVRKIEEDDGRERIQIIDDTGRNICSEKEYLSRYGQKEFRNYSRLVDLIRIITIDDVHETVMEVIEGEEEKEKEKEKEKSSTPQQLKKVRPKQVKKD